MKNTRMSLATAMLSAMFGLGQMFAMAERRAMMESLFDRRATRKPRFKDRSLPRGYPGAKLARKAIQQKITKKWG